MGNRGELRRAVPSYPQVSVAGKGPHRWRAGTRLVEGDHNIDCRLEGLGAMQLESEFVKRA